MTKVLWLVMDGRAVNDPSDATVYEAILGVLEQPPRKSVKRDWGQRGAVLCYAERLGPEKYGPVQFLEMIP